MCATRTESELPTHFYRPLNGRTHNLYVRLVPPKEVQHIVGKAEFRKSTGTADLRKAKAIGSRLIADKRAEWEHALAKAGPRPVLPIALTTRKVEDICAKRLYQWLHMDDLGRYEGTGYDDATLAGLSSLWDSTELTMRSVLSRGKASPQWQEALEVVDFWCHQIDTPVSRSDPLYPQLVRKFAEVDMQGTAMVRGRTAGDTVPTPIRPGSTGLAMSAMTDAFRAHLQESKQGKGLTTPVGIWVRFVNYLGDLPIEDVQPEDVFKFLKHGLHAPSMQWSMKYTHGTVRRTIRAVFSLAITTGRRRGANPVDSVTELPRITDADEQERLSPRRPYSDGEISQLLSSEWYDRHATNWRGKMATDLGARYWTPLICLHHGNRVREVMQLVASDFTSKGELNLMTVQVGIEGGQSRLKDAGISRSLKNPSTRRTVPLHPQLVALGFLDFLQGRRDTDGINALLFPSSVPEPGGKTPILGRAYEQAFVRFVKQAVGHGLGNHGFRHQLEDRIRNAQTPGNQWPAGLGQQYMGRKTTRAKGRDILLR